jgi:ubiquinone biosynthesis protein COQ4
MRTGEAAWTKGRDGTEEMEMTTRGVASRRIQPLEAIKAIQILLANPDDTSQVFRIIRALTGNSYERLFQKVLADPQGRQILDEKRDILPLLEDREALRALPDGTLGREYARFLDGEGLDAAGLVHSSMELADVDFLDDRARVLKDRLRDVHDLWHVVTGYHRDIVGEVALLAFTYAQTGNWGIAFIVLMASIKLRVEGHSDAVGIVWRAYRRGVRARFFPAADWEALLQVPLAEVRRQLRITELPLYTPMFSPAAAAAH